jgi:hypothetical protein
VHCSVFAVETVDAAQFTLTAVIVGEGGWVPPPELLPPPQPARVIQLTRAAKDNDDVKFERARPEKLLPSRFMCATPLFRVF